MGKGGGGGAPSADPAIGQAALMQADLGKDLLDFAQVQFDAGNVRQEEMDALSKKLVEQQYGISEQQNQWANEDRDRYKDVFQPVEDQFIEEATNYATPEKQAQAAAEAKADVMVNAAGVQAQNERQMAGMGVNPNSGRFAGIDRSADVATGLGAAGAQNNARQMVRDKGLALKADVANMGRGLPAQSAQATSVGLNAGNSAMGNVGAANQAFSQNNQIMNQGFGGAMQGYGNQAGILNQQYGNQLNAWSQQQQADAANSAGLLGGIGSMVGTGAALYMF